MVPNPEDARDLLQEVLLKAYRGLRHFCADASFYTWIYRIAVNTCIDFRRARGRTPATVSLAEESLADGDYEPVDTRWDADPHQALWLRELQAYVNQAIEALEEPFRTAVVLRDVEGRTQQEIAEIMGCPLGTVKTRIHRGRMELRSKLAPYGEARWIVVSPETSMTRQAQGTLAELKPNDTIVVSGVPLAIAASQLQVGEIPPMGFGGPGGGFPGGPGGPGPGGAAGGRGGGEGRQPEAGAGRGGQTGGQPMTRLTGTIVSTNPLVVMLPGNVRVSVQAASSTKVTRIVKQTLADLKAGDTVLAMGRPDENNVITAMQVLIGVNLNAGPGFGGGAFRRGGGGERL
jgi:RNA polymerase sigma-70 factor (ECF subfamily)